MADHLSIAKQIIEHFDSAEEMGKQLLKGMPVDEADEFIDEFLEEAYLDQAQDRDELYSILWQEYEKSLLL